MVSFKFATLLATAALSVLPGAEAAKRGLAWPSDNPFNPNVFLPGGKVDWIYNWGLDKKPIFSSIPSFYGMQWGSGGIASLATKFQQSGSGFLLGFNEPDNGGQSNLSPSTAASLWKQYIEPIKAQNSTVKLISPAITNAGAPGGFAWLDSFLSSCNGCHIDGIAIHWYGGWIDDFKAFVNDAKKYNKPLYLTEFGLEWDQYATVDSWTQFLPLAMSFLDNEPAVVKYAFFGAFYSNTAKDMLNANASVFRVDSTDVFGYLLGRVPDADQSIPVNWPEKKRMHAGAPEPATAEEPRNWAETMDVDGDGPEHVDGEDDDEPALKKLRIEEPAAVVTDKFETGQATPS